MEFGSKHLFIWVSPCVYQVLQCPVVHETLVLRRLHPSSGQGSCYDIGITLRRGHNHAHTIVLITADVVVDKTQNKIDNCQMNFH